MEEASEITIKQTMENTNEIIKQTMEETSEITDYHPTH